jgi:DNA-binding protein
MAQEQSDLNAALDKAKNEQKSEEKPQEEQQASEEEKPASSEQEEEKQEQKPEEKGGDEKPEEEQQEEKPQEQKPEEAKPEQKAKEEQKPEQEKRPAQQQGKQQDRQPRKQSRAADNVVLVGKKPTMSYVLAAVTQFSDGMNQIQIKARGRSISRAVDVAEVVKNRFVQGVKTNVEIGTDEITDDNGNKLNVSTINIQLDK